MVVSAASWQPLSGPSTLPPFAGCVVLSATVLSLICSSAAAPPPVAPSATHRSSLFHWGCLEPTFLSFGWEPYPCRPEVSSYGLFFVCRHGRFGPRQGSWGFPSPVAELSALLGPSPSYLRKAGFPRMSSDWPLAQSPCCGLPASSLMPC